MKNNPRQKRGTIRIVIYGIFFVAVLVLVGLFVVFRDQIDSDTIKGITQIVPFGSESAAPAEEVVFDAGNSNLYGVYNGKLAVLSSERLALYGTSGAEVFSRAVAMENPVLQTSGDRVMAYDRGGRLIITDGKDALLELEGPVLGARLNSRQWLTVISKGDRHRGVVTVYDNKCKTRFTWNSSHYILDAAVSPNGRTLVIASAVQDGDRLTGRLAFHDTSSPEGPVNELSYADRLPLSILFPDNDRVCVVMEEGVEFLDGSGEKLADYSAGSKVFVEYAASQDFLLLHMKYSSTGQVGELTTLDYDGNSLASVSLSGNVADISANGRYFSVLAGSSLEIFNEKCEKIDTLGDCAYVRKIIQQQDGSVYLLAGDIARLYIPK